MVKFTGVYAKSTGNGCLVKQRPTAILDGAELGTSSECSTGINIVSIQGKCDKTR